MNIGLLYEVRPEAPPDHCPADLYFEFETLDTIQGIVRELEEIGYTVHMIDSQDEPLERLRSLRGSLDLVLNISVGFGSRFRELMPAAICEALEIHYTGSDPMAQAMAANKHLSKLQARHHGVPTPDWLLVNKIEDLSSAALPGRKLILKPIYEGSSIGIVGPVDITDGREALEMALQRLLAVYKQPVLVEAFVEGFEVTVPVLGNPPRALSPVALSLDGSLDLGDKVFDAFRKATDRAALWEVNPPLASGMLTNLQAWAIRIHNALGCRDLSRSDFRIDRQGGSFFVEINATPQISPQGSSFVTSASVEGMNFRGLLKSIVEISLTRGSGGLLIPRTRDH